MSKFITLLLIFTVILTSSAQSQAPVVLSKSAQAVKDKVSSLSIADHISIIRVQGDEEFGKYLSRDESGFTFYDVDRKLNVTALYTEVKKVKLGYGGYNPLNQRHTDRTKALIVVGIVLVVLGGVIGAAAAAKN